MTWSSTRMMMTASWRVVSAWLLCWLLCLAAPGWVQAGVVERVSVAAAGTQGNFESGAPSISADGRYVAFVSLAGNLVAGDTNGRYDVFVYDRQADTIRRASVATGGVQANGDSRAPFISGDGSCVAFLSSASNLVSGDTNGRSGRFRTHLGDRRNRAGERGLGRVAGQR